MMLKNKMRPIHPGEVLREEFLVPLNMTPHALAMALRVPASRVNDIVLERRGITADTAARLARFFGTTPEFWLNLQAAYDLKTLATMRRIEQDVRPLNAHP
jgi:addiction module HigA family antidote